MQKSSVLTFPAAFFSIHLFSIATIVSHARQEKGNRREETVSKGELVIFPCIGSLAPLGDYKNETLTGQALPKLLESINFTAGPPISITTIVSSLKLQ